MTANPTADGTATATAAGASDRTPWHAVGLLVATGVAGAAQLGKIPPMVAALQADLGLSLVAIGWTMSVITLVGAVLGLSAGSLLGATAMKRSLIAALVLMAAAGVLGTVADGAAGLLAVRAVEGVGYLVITVACPALIAHTASDSGRPLALALWGCFVPVGLGLMNLIAPPLAELGSWRWVFAAGAAVMAGMALAIAAMPMRQPTPHRGGLLAGFVADHRAALGHPPALLIAFAFFWFAGLHVGFLALLPAWATLEAGLSPAAAGRIAAVSALAYIPGALAGGWLVRRGLAPWAIGVAGYAVLAVTAAGTLLLPGLVAIAAAAAVALSVAAGAIGAILFAGAPGCAPSVDRVRLVMGLFAQAGSIGVLVMPPALAWLAEAAGWTATLPLFALGAALAAVALFTIRRPLARS